MTRKRSVNYFSDTLSKLKVTKSVMYNNYFVDSTKIEGMRIWKNTGLNSNGQPTSTRTATDMKITLVIEKPLLGQHCML